MDQEWYEDVYVQLFVTCAVLLALKVLGVIASETMAVALGGTAILINAVHVSELRKKIDRLERQLNRE